jgi:hypothetical protein
MRYVILILSLLTFRLSAFSQRDILTAANRAELVKNLDSAMHSTYFISPADAEKILEKPALLTDSTYKFSSGILRYSFDYVAKYVDSTSKGKISFGFEQYKDTLVAKNNYEFIKTENQKDGNFTELKNLGNSAFLKKDALGQPFIMAIKDNKIYKFRIFYLTSENSLTALIKTAKKIITSH